MVCMRDITGKPLDRIEVVDRGDLAHEIAAQFDPSEPGPVTEAMIANYVCVRTSDGKPLPQNYAVVITLDKSLAELMVSPAADIEDITFVEIETLGGN